MESIDYICNFFDKNKKISMIVISKHIS